MKGSFVPHCSYWRTVQRKSGSCSSDHWSDGVFENHAPAAKVSFPPILWKNDVLQVQKVVL